MTNIFEITLAGRKIMARILENHTLEQLNKIPVGFSNNLIWNVGHNIVSQQILNYKLGNVPLLLSETLIEKYRKGTKPTAQITQTDVDELKAVVFSTIEQTEKDYKAGTFHNFTEYENSIGITLKNIDDALNYNCFHEALHIGVMMSISKLI